VTISQFSALIFDMDGLMVDSEPVWWRVEQAFAESQGILWTDEQARACVGKGLEHVIETMRETLGVSVSVEDGVRQLQKEFVARRAEIVLKPGCEELVSAAQDQSLALAVASSSPSYLINAVLDQVSMIHPFDLLLSGVDVPRPKPSPDIFLEAAKRLTVAPEHCVVLEDSIAGVQAGVAAGMTVIAIPEDEPARFAEMTPHVLTDLHEARHLLRLNSRSL